HRAAKREPTRHRSLQRRGRRESPSFTGARMSSMQFGSRKVARAQLHHLLAVIEKPHITLRVIPFDAGA
ncbi:Scr1 family TA system antitoxin-like transcriptional regulator, partial [Streptomyces sp. NPDC047985]|uniref:Scr1 family TA system antitoxin-like transcriptional regulator n=1 Tax=unclassified Streptomyces TaxID=2593676 RepID=UPI0034362F11